MYCVITGGDLIYVKLTENVCNEFGIQLQKDDNTCDNNDTDNISIDNLQESSGNIKLWTRDTIIFLISKIENEYESNNFDKDLKKNLWMKIAEQYSQAFQTTFTPDNVESKWKSLKRTYKTILLHNRSTGKHRRNWEFFSLINKFMYHRPEITPQATCSNISGLQVHSENAGMEKTTETAAVKELQEEAPCDSCSFSKKRKSKSNAAAQRHQEKMQRMDKFNELFEQMITKMPPPTNNN